MLLPRLEEKELPHEAGAHAGRVAEERRLFYVGLTRAKRVLAVTWVGEAEPLPRRADAAARPPAEERPEGFEALKAWRLARARAEEVPGVRRLPQLDAGGDRRPPAEEPRGARRRPRRRPGEARALRRGGPSRARRAAGRAGRSGRVVAARAAAGSAVEVEVGSVARAGRAGPRGSASRRLRRAARRTSCRRAFRARPPRGSSSRRPRRPTSAAAIRLCASTARSGTTSEGRPRRADRLALLVGARQDDGVDARRPGRAARARRGRAGCRAGGRARPPAACGRRPARLPAGHVDRRRLEVGEVVLLLQAGVAAQLRRVAPYRASRSAGIASGTTTRVAARQPSWCWSQANS